MARFTVAGIDEEADDLLKMANYANDACDAVLNAMADVYVDAWKNSIQTQGHVASHAMVNAVGKSDPTGDGTDRSITVYPLGSDSRGVRNALKAYVTHYGRGGKKTTHTGDHFVDKAEQMAESKADAAAEEAFDNWINKTKG